MKSPEELRFDTVASRYQAQFGRPYAILICDQRSGEEHISIMEKAMEKGQPVPDPDPEVDENIDI